MVPANKSINHDDKMVRERPRGDTEDVLAAAVGLDLDDALAVFAFALEAATANLPQHLHTLTGAPRRRRRRHERPPSRRRESKPYAE